MPRWNAANRMRSPPNLFEEQHVIVMMRNRGNPSAFQHLHKAEATTTPLISFAAKPTANVPTSSLNGGGYHTNASRTRTPATAAVRHGPFR